MANRFCRLYATLRGLLVGGGLSVAFLTGCQATSHPVSSHVAVGVPAPSFDGPKIVPNAPAPSAPRTHAAAPSGPSAWQPRAAARSWKWIVIHHSASPAGNMALFDKEHKSKGWDGIGYHFVIGNGTNSGDGQIEVTPRWPAQKWGAHAKTADNRYNEQGIGICLVGNFDLDRPTQAQLRSLADLTAYLMQTYRIPAESIVGHRDTKATECPGRYVNLAAVRQMATRGIAARDVAHDRVNAQAASSELLGDIAR